MGLIVADASVAVKWVLKETGSASALVLLRRSEPILAPELLRTEGAGAITRAFRNGRLSLDDTERALAHWLGSLESGAVQLIPDQLDLRRAAALSCELRHPLPDCLYLARAERVGGTLLTADATFTQRALPAYPRVKLLAADA